MDGSFAIGFPVFSFEAIGTCWRGVGARQGDRGVILWRCSDCTGVNSGE